MRPRRFQPPLPGPFRSMIEIGGGEVMTAEDPLTPRTTSRYREKAHPVPRRSTLLALVVGLLLSGSIMMDWRLGRASPNIRVTPIVKAVRRASPAVVQKEDT